MADDWPDDLPRPLENPIADSDEWVADELCRAVCLCILHHEIAHVVLQHRSDANDEQSISQEKDADIAAAEWTLGGLDDSNDPRYIKRLLGIVLAFVLPTALGLYGASFGGKRHPFSYDRLSSLIDRFLGRDPHVARTFAASVILLHLNNSGRQFQPQQKFASFGEALEAVCDQLAEEISSLSRGTPRSR